MLEKTLISAVALLIPLAGLADGAKVKWPDCFCTDTSGARVELGETICLTVDGRSFQARCEMMLNNPMWREVGSGCTVSRREKPPQAPVAATQIANG